MKYCLLACALAAFSSVVSALSIQKALTRSSNDEDDGTPLPLVIWHGLGDVYAHKTPF